MDRRLELHALLESLLPEGKKAYFQPPENVQMSYPCIVYQRDYADVQFAGNKPYRQNTRYQVTVIDPDPDSPIRDAVEELPMCLFVRFFTAGFLNHDVFEIYF